MGRIGPVLAAFLVVAATAPVAAQQAGPAPQQPSLELSLLTPGAPSQVGGSLLEGRDLAQAGRWYFDLGGSGSSMSRERSFKFGIEVGGPTTGPWGAPAEPLKYDVNGTGWGGSASLGYWVNNWLGIEVSASGVVQESTQNSNACGNRQVVDTFILPSILGPGPAIDFFCGAGSGSSIPGNSRLTYNQNLIDGHADARIRLWEAANRKSAVEAVVGIAYLHVTQQFDNEVKANNFNGTGGSLQTNIDLRDNLAGGRVGARGQYEFAPGWKLLAGVLGDFYARWTDMDATQDGRNISVDISALINYPKFTAQRTTSNTGFVPRLEANLSLSYDLTPGWSLGLFYKFDGLWNMTAVREPNLTSCPIRCSSTGTLDIRDDDRLFLHTVGLGVTGRF